MAGLAQVKGAPLPGEAGNPIDADDDASVLARGDYEAAQMANRVPEGGTYASMSNSSAPSAPGKGDPNLIIGAGIGQRDVGRRDPLAAPGVAAGQAAANQDDADQVASGQAMPVAAPSYTIPAHWQAGTHAVAMQRGMDPDELEEGEQYRDAATGQGLLASDKRLEAAQRAGMADGIYATARAAAAQKANERIAEINREKAAFVQTEQAKLEKFAVAAQKQVDPEAYWKDKGTLGRLGAAIAIGLGQFGALMRGGPNTAWQIIQSGIQENIDAQKANIATAKHAFDMKQSLYARNLMEFGDREKAALATKINYLDQVAGMVDQMKVAAGQSANEANYHDIQKKIFDERAQTKDQFAIRTHTQVSEQENEHFVPAQRIGGGAAAMKRPGNLITLTDGTTVQMASDTEHKEAVAKIQSLDRLQRLNNEILTLRQQTAKLDPLLDKTQYDTNMAKLNDMAIDKIDLMSIAKEQGVVKEAEFARAKNEQSMATNGLGLFKGNPIAAKDRDVADEVIRAQNERWNKDQHAYVRASGVPIVKKGYVADANGRLTPAGAYTGQDVDLPSTLAPRGSAPMDGSTKVRAQGAPLSETTPAAERFDVPATAKKMLKSGNVKAPTPKKQK